MEILKVVLTYVLTALPGRPHRLHDPQSWIKVFVRPWYPPRVVKLVAETIFTLTDPPLKFLRRYIPPLRIGTVAMDLSFMVLFIVVLILLRWLCRDFEPCTVLIRYGAEEQRCFRKQVLTKNTVLGNAAKRAEETRCR